MYDQAFEFVKAGRVPAGPKGTTKDHDEVPLDEADWTLKSIKGHNYTMEFVKQDLSCPHTQGHYYLLEP